MVAKMTLGVFSDRETADMAVTKLEQAGYRPEEMSVVMKEGVVNREKEGVGAHVAGGMASGAAVIVATGTLTGALAGGLVGSLVDLGIPWETADMVRTINVSE